jgi:hypothetical protein
MQEQRRLVHGQILLTEGGESAADCEEDRADTMNKPLRIFTASDDFHGMGRRICVLERAAMVGAS